MFAITHFFAFFIAMFFNITKKEILDKYELSRTPSVDNVKKMVESAKSIKEVLDSDSSDEDAKKIKEKITSEITSNIDSTAKGNLTKTFNKFFADLWGQIHATPELAFIALEVLNTAALRIEDLADYLIVEHTRDNNEAIALSEADNNFALDTIVDMARAHFGMLVMMAESVEEMEELTVKSNLPVKEGKDGYILSVSKKRGAPKSGTNKNVNVGRIGCKILKGDTIVEEFDNENFDTVIFRHVNPLLGTNPTTPFFVYSKIKEDLSKGSAELRLGEDITLQFSHPFKK